MRHTLPSIVVAGLVAGLSFAAEARAYDEITTPFAGGSAAALNQLAARLISRGWTHWNLSPANLRQTPSGELRLIDLGTSLRRPSSDDHARLVRKAIVLWRFAGHPDLSNLLTRSADPALPEAMGWQSALELLSGPSPKEQLDDMVATFAAHRTGPVLDLGCGKPGPLALAVAPRMLAACEVDESLRARWATQEHARFCSTADVDVDVARGERWSTVICSLVLCAVDAQQFRDGTVQGVAHQGAETGHGRDLVRTGPQIEDLEDLVAAAKHHALFAGTKDRCLWADRAAGRMDACIEDPVPCGFNGSIGNGRK